MNKANIIPQDDQTTPGEGHPEDETTGGAGRMRTVVAPNPKCMGCLHYDNTRSHCMVALAPASCGDGSKPEAGYAPMVPSEEAYQEWRAKRGLAHNAPRGGPVSVGADGSGAKGPVGGPQGAPDFVVQVLGDEGHVQLSEEPGDLSKGSKGQSKLSRQGYGVHQVGSRYLTTHVPPGQRSGKFTGPAEGFKTAREAIKFNKQSSRQPMGKSGDTEKCMKCGNAMKAVGSDCSKCKYKSLRNTVAFDSTSQADRVGGPVNKAGGKISWGAIKRQAKQSKGYGMPGHKYGGSATEKLHEGKKPKSYAQHLKRMKQRSLTASAEYRPATGKVRKGSIHAMAAGYAKVGKVVHAPGLSAAQKKKNEASLNRMTKMPRSSSFKTKVRANAKNYFTPSGIKLKVRKADPWAIATAAWQKVSDGKKAQYVKRAMARHRKAGEDVHASKYANRAPREFMERLASKSGGSLIEEFGHGLGGYLYKARHDIRKAVTTAMPKLKAPGMKQGYAGEDHDKTAHLNVKPIDTHNPKRGAGPQATEQSKTPEWKPGQTVTGAKVDPNKSPVLHAVRSRQMKNPSAVSQLKARQAGGGKIFSHSSLAEHAGVKPEQIADLAHASNHVHEFHNKVRQEFGDKVKHLTSAQIRSAYHSTGLEHSLTIADLDLIKAHKHGKRHCLGHTTSGKPIHSDGHMAESLQGEEHEEAAEVHGDIASKLQKIANPWGSMSGDSKLGHASRKYVQQLAEHHQKLSSRHRETANKHRMEKNKLTGLVDLSPMPFGKSAPTDAEVAKAMMAGGGAGALVGSGYVNAPLNLGVNTSSLDYGLQTRAELVEVKEEAKPEPKRRTPIVGGVLSAAWDLGQPYEE